MAENLLNQIQQPAACECGPLKGMVRALESKVEGLEARLDHVEHILALRLPQEDRPGLFPWLGRKLRLT
jgi:hypothetical protein